MGSTLGGGEMDLSRASTPSRAPADLCSSEEVVGTESQGGSKSVDEKICCYQCYRQFFTKFAVERQAVPQPGVAEGCGHGDTKSFCSEPCAQKWEEVTRAKADAFRKRQEKLQKFEAIKAASQGEAAVA